MKKAVAWTVAVVCLFLFASPLSAAQTSGEARLCEDGERKSDTLNREGLEALQREEYQAAQAKFVEAQKLDPQNKNAYLNQAIALMRLGNYDEAGGALKKAIELDPKWAMPLITKGDCLFERKQYDKALEAYITAATLEGNVAQAHVGAYKVYTATEEPLKARETLEKASDLYPGEVSINEPLATLLLAENNPRAVGVLYRIQAVQPDAPRLNDRLALAWYHAGNDTMAGLIAERTLEDDPKALNSLWVLSNLMVRREQFDRADKYIASLEEMGADPAQVKLLKLAVATHKKDEKAAATLFDELKTADPENPVWLEQVAYTYGPTRKASLSLFAQAAKLYRTQGKELEAKRLEKLIKQ